MGDQSPPYVTIRSRRPAPGSSSLNAGETVRVERAAPWQEGPVCVVLRRSHSVIVQNGEYTTPSATHDISRVSFHVKHIDTFAKSLEDVRSLSLPLARSDAVHAGSS